LSILTLMLHRFLTLILGVALAFVVTLTLGTHPAGAAQALTTSGPLTPREASFDVTRFGATAATHRVMPPAWSGVAAEGPLYIGGGSIAGRVTNASGGVAIEKISVCAQTQIGDDSFGVCEGSNANGEYTISNLPSGSYTVEFSPGYPCVTCVQQNYITQYYDDKSSLTEAQALPVTVGSTTSGIDAQMVEGGEITGTVTNISGGAAIEGIEVCTFLDSEGRTRCASTNASGEYTLTGLASSSYKVVFSTDKDCGSLCPVQDNYLTQYYNGKPSFAEADAVPVTAGSTTSGIDAQMAEGGRITGKVTNVSGGVAIEGIDVCASQTGGGDLEGCASTNSDGEYMVPALPSGSYDVVFFAGEVCKSTCPRQNYITQYYNGKPSLAAVEAVQVTAGSTTSEIDAQMVEGGQITGRVTNASGGTPIEGIEVCALGGNEELGGNCAATSSNGEYTVQALASGSYQVEFSASGGYNCEPNCAQNYLTQYYNGKPSLAAAEPVSVTVGSTTPGIDAQMAEHNNSLPGPSRPPVITVERPPPAPPVLRPPPSAKATETSTLDISTVKLQNSGEAAVKLSCQDTAACAVRLTLAAKVTTHRDRHKHVKTQIIAGGAFSILAGQTMTFELRLNATGRELLRVAHGHLRATLTVFKVSLGSSSTWIENVELTQEKAKRRK
jgi:Carboxypeptidase regulatory-like domain